MSSNILSRKPKLERFQEHVLARFQIYNSIFLTLPFDEITSTGSLLPLFGQLCEEGYQMGKNPTEIVDAFFKRYQDEPGEEEKVDLLFRFIQYIERQVVLFDAIEDAAFPLVNNMYGRGTLRNIKEEAEEKDKTEELKTYLEEFKVRPVLTAHPTQFYPGTVLGIITDLSKAVVEDDLLAIKRLLAQLGKTPFIKREKPTPYDEAVSLIWYLENVFYQTGAKIFNYIQKNIYKQEQLHNQVVEIGFWPGGDRDGNPFVTTATTLRTAQRLRSTILKNYYRDIRVLKRRMTFKNVEDKIAELETLIYHSIYLPAADAKINLEQLQTRLLEVREVIIQRHNSLFLEELDDLINKTHLFGFHFATLDIRQDSRIHDQAFNQIIQTLSETWKQPDLLEYQNWDFHTRIEFLSKLSGDVDPKDFPSDWAGRTLESIRAAKQIQDENGERACNRYIISNCRGVQDVMQLYSMIRLSGWENPQIDIVPLFETIKDLENAVTVMETLYAFGPYKEHLNRRGNKQTVMLGFSDGTKDGGYLMANWSIFKAKEQLTKISREFGIKVVFFDGRGGPPARGGGNTHKFYSSLGESVENREVQLTIQGQTISSNFGTVESCQFNLEQLLSSGIRSQVFHEEETHWNKEDKDTMERLAALSYVAYSDFKQHPKFIPYLEKMSTLPYYANTNIGSRPVKRGKSTELRFEDLRAIPFVGSWSQLKQNVPGFFGVGTSIEHFKKNGEMDKVKRLYQHSPFFRTLLENSMMSLTKSFFPLTAYMEEDPVFGGFWKLIFDEHQRTKTLILELTGYDTLMQHEPAGRASIQIRETIVKPLLTIQQYALRKIKELENQEKVDLIALEVYKKMVTRSLFGNINASRNSA